MASDRPVWASVDDPNPYYPKCDHCTAFARWSIARAEDVGPPLSGEISFFVRWFACGSHVNRAHVYDITYPPERS